MVGRIKAPVSERTVSALKKRPGMHAVGGAPGLYLLVSETSQSWILRYSFDGQRHDMGLGSCSLVTLAQARERAIEQRRLVLDGVNPIEVRRQRQRARMLSDGKRMTFSQCVDAFLAAQSDAWRSAKHREQWRTTLQTYACPRLGRLNVADIDTTLIHSVLEPLWRKKTETASRLRGRIEKVLGWATVRGYRLGENPARWRGHMDQLLPAPAKLVRVKHHPALPYREIGAFLTELRAQPGVASLALQFLILTATRSGEVRKAVWTEFDLDGRLWIIPASRMKAGREHRVPLTEAALNVLHQALRQRSSEFVFSGARDGTSLSDMSLTACLRRMNRNDVVPHGFRSTFRDWAAEVGTYPRELAEVALAHSVGDETERAYQRGDMLDKRRRMMEAWAQWCTEPRAVAYEAVSLKE